MFSAMAAGQYHQDTAAAADRAGFNPVTTSLSSVLFVVVAFGVLGVLVTSGEYSTGMIRSSLTAVPRRLPVLRGKLAMFPGVIFPVSLIASFISFFLGQMVLDSHHLGVPISAPGALRSVIGAALYITVAGMIGGITGFWNGPVAATTKRVSRRPSEVCTVKPGRPPFLRTEVTSTPQRTGAAIFSA